MGSNCAKPSIVALTRKATGKVRPEAKAKISGFSSRVRGLGAFLFERRGGEMYGGVELYRVVRDAVVVV